VPIRDDLGRLIGGQARMNVWLHPPDTDLDDTTARLHLATDWVMEDYGWRLREGTIATPSGGVGGANPDAVDPVYEYFHGSGSFQGNSVTGGVVYRGPDRGLNGRYLFADFVSSNYWSFDPADPAGTVENINGDLAAGSADNGPVAFFEDLDGNVYIATISGNILRVDTTPPGDYDGDGFVTLDDLDAWAARYGGQDLSADGNGDGVVDAADYVVWRNNLPPQEPSDAVPEPATLGLIVLGSLIAASNRRPPAA